MTLTRSQIAALNRPRNIRDDGRLVSTGERPADWYVAASNPNRGSDR